MRKVQDMTKQEFETAWLVAGDGGQVGKNVIKRYTSEVDLEVIRQLNRRRVLTYWYAGKFDDKKYGKHLHARFKGLK